MADQGLPGNPPPGHVANAFIAVSDSVSTNPFFGLPQPGNDPFSEISFNKPAMVSGGMQAPLERNPTDHGLAPFSQGSVVFAGPLQDQSQIPTGDGRASFLQGNMEPTGPQQMSFQHYPPTQATATVPPLAFPNASALFGGNSGAKATEDDFFSSLQPHQSTAPQSQNVKNFPLSQQGPLVPQAPLTPPEQVPFDIGTEIPLNLSYESRPLPETEMPVGGPLSLPSAMPSSVNESFHESPFQQGSGKSTSAPSTGLVHTIGVLDAMQTRSLADDSLVQQPLMSNTIQSTGVGASDDNIAEPTPQIFSNSSSALSSPMTRPPSNADKNATNIPPVDAPFPYRTNADPGYGNGTGGSGSGPKRPLTNLECNSDPAKALLTSNLSQAERLGHPNIPSSLVGDDTQHKSASVTSSTSDGEKAPSLSSSHNQSSLCSLLDSQEEFAYRSSPIKLVAPAPYDTHGPPNNASSSSPAGATGRVDNTPSLPPFSLPSTVDTRKCTQATAPVSGPIQNQRQDIAPEKDSSISPAMAGQVQGSLPVSSSTISVVSERLIDAIVSQEEHCQPQHHSVVSHTTASDVRLQGSLPAVSSRSGSERLDSLEDWEIVDHSNTCTSQQIQSSTYDGLSATLSPPPLAGSSPTSSSFSGVETSEYLHQSSPQMLGYTGASVDSSQQQQLSCSDTSTLLASSPPLPLMVGKGVLDVATVSELSCSQPMESRTPGSVTVQSSSVLAATYSDGSSFIPTMELSKERIPSSSTGSLTSTSEPQPASALQMPATSMTGLELPTSAATFSEFQSSDLKLGAGQSDARYSSQPTSSAFPVNQSMVQQSSSDSSLSTPFAGSGYDTVAVPSDMYRPTALATNDSGPMSSQSVSSSNVYGTGAGSLTPSVPSGLQSNIAQVLPPVCRVSDNQVVESGPSCVQSSLPPSQQAVVTSFPPVCSLQSSRLPAEATLQDHPDVGEKGVMSEANMSRLEYPPPIQAAALVPSGGLIGNGSLGTVLSGEAISAPPIFHQLPADTRQEEHLPDMRMLQIGQSPPGTVASSQSFTSFEAVSSDDPLLQKPPPTMPGAPPTMPEVTHSAFSALPTGINQSTSIDQFQLGQEIGTQTSDQNLHLTPASTSEVHPPPVTGPIPTTAAMVPPPTTVAMVPPPTTAAIIPPPTTVTMVPPPTTVAMVPPPTTAAMIPPPTTAAMIPSPMTVAMVPPPTTVAMIPPPTTAAMIPPPTTAAMIPSPMTVAMVPPTMTVAMVPPTTTAAMIPPPTTVAMVQPSMTAATVQPPTTVAMVPPPIVSAVSDSQVVPSQFIQSHTDPRPDISESYHVQTQSVRDPPASMGSGYGDRHQQQPYTDQNQSFYSRPQSRASYGYPDQTHQPPPPPNPHQHYGPYYQGQPRYDPYYGTRFDDPYQQPPPHDPHYDPYGYGLQQQPGYYQGYPHHDPRYNFMPPPVRYPYGHDPYYLGDAYAGGQYPPNPNDPYFQSQVDPYHPYPQYATEQQPQAAAPDVIDSRNLLEPSMIQGESAGGFEISQIYPSPNSTPGGRPSVQPLESTALEQNNTPLAAPRSSQLREEARGESAAYYDRGGMAYLGNNEGYPNEVVGYPQEEFRNNPADQTLESNETQEIWEPVTPPPPERMTPHRYHCPHVRASFGFGGQLVTILPTGVGDENLGRVEIQNVQNLLNDDSSQKFAKEVSDSAGPLIPGETPKSSVFNFSSRKVQESMENGDNEDEQMLWEFLKLLCQQNGVIVPSDVADLLIEGRNLDIKPAPPQNMEECLDSLRQFLFSGRKKNALEYACSKGLWGHALMLASRMDEPSRNYVVNRFTASLSNADPLSTFYTLLLGRTPAAVRQEGLVRAGDWRPHLSMILANKSSKLDTESIVFLGDSLLNTGKVCAAHLCYYLADVHFGLYGDASSRYSLLGVEEHVNKAGWYPLPHQLGKMEVLEYAMSLSRQEVAFPSFQLFKLLHVLKLTEYGLVQKAVKYCEQISHTVLKRVDRYVPTMLSVLLDISLRLHHFTTEYGVVSGELPSWLKQLERSVTSILSTDYSPHLTSPSPAFSSVSQTYSNGGGARNVKPQLTIGLQQDAASNHLTVPSQRSTIHASQLEDRSSLYQHDEVSREGLETLGRGGDADVVPSGMTLAAPLGYSAEQTMQEVGSGGENTQQQQQQQQQSQFQNELVNFSQQQQLQPPSNGLASGNPDTENQYNAALNSYGTVSGDQAQGASQIAGPSGFSHGNVMMPYTSETTDHVQHEGQVAPGHSAGQSPPQNTTELRGFDGQNFQQVYGGNTEDNQGSSINLQATVVTSEGGNEQDSHNYNYGNAPPTSNTFGQVSYAPPSQYEETNPGAGSGSGRQFMDQQQSDIGEFREYEILNSIVKLIGC